LVALIQSALANAKNNHQMEREGLVVAELRVDAGQVLKRSLPMSRGRAFRMKKRMSHVRLVLAPAVKKVEKKGLKSQVPSDK
jgi:large subunit ribosomal protein L22